MDNLKAGQGNCWPFDAFGPLVWKSEAGLNVFYQFSAQASQKAFITAASTNFELFWAILSSFLAFRAILSWLGLFFCHSIFCLKSFHLFSARTTGCMEITWSYKDIIPFCGIFFAFKCLFVKINILIYHYEWFYQGLGAVKHCKWQKSL